MATIVKPQVLVFQEFQIVPTEITQPLRAHVSGPNAMLHRHSVAAEKALIDVGAYDPNADHDYLWPQRKAGSVVDQSSVKLYVDDALLEYFQDLIGDAVLGHGLIAPVSGKKNWIRSDVLSFKANGTEYPRSNFFYDRDVNVGDVVHLRGVTSPDDDCIELDLWTTVAGFAAETVAGTVEDCRTESNNQATVAGACTINPAGAQDGITATPDGTDYDGYASGYIEEVYTIEVIRSSISGCNAARLRVTSESGTDDQAEVQAADWGDPTDIGTRGLHVTFTRAGSDEFIIGQTWTVTVAEGFARVCCEATGDYDGADDDIYIATVTKGGKWADLPQITVTTAKGLDFSGPTTVTAEGAEVPVGSDGVGIRFWACENPSSGDSEDVGGTVNGLCYGDKFYITVVSGTNGRIGTLILRDDLPVGMRTVSDMDLELYIKKNIEVTEDRLSDAPNVNYELEETQLIVLAGITAYDATWTHNGVPLPMDLKGGTQYIEYREWLVDTINMVGSINDVANLDVIPGQLDPENPLKWGVYRALQNSNGTYVKYTGVLHPESLDSWQNVLERVEGHSDLYNYAPLTFNKEVLDLFAAQAAAESSPEAGNWKAMFAALQAVTSKMIVGKSAAGAQLLHPTSTDGNVVLATLEDNPEADGLQYTKLSVPAGNAGFITHGVQAGDIVRYLFTIDAWSNATYHEFTVDEVLSESSLLLLENHGAPVTVAQKIEIWHALTKNEVVADLKAQAQAFASRRVCAVWPDYVGTAGVTQEGYFLCAALAGLASAVVPQQPLTNVAVAGFDDFSRSSQFFSRSQLDDLNDGGVWICTVDDIGTPYTWHALTTDLTGLNQREEMIRRNVDSISYLFLNRLKPYIGRCNVTPSMLTLLRHQLGMIIDWLKANGTTPQLGSQLIDATITTLEIHPLLADRIYCVLNLVVPAPLDNLELHLVI